ncbi:MAG: hypothetical protein IKL65_01870 [Bacilli bacterium]|nr:hypothetical protein [Bacilli bacterium]
MKKKKLLIEGDSKLMARYKLGVIVKKEGRIIDLSKLINLKDLESLDDFTVEFNNEGELITYLFNKQLITSDELKQNASIKVMYKSNGKIKNVPVMYKEMKKYLDVIQLKYELLSLRDNVVFLEKLANFYSNGSTTFNKQGLNVQDIKGYLLDVRKNDGKTFYSKALEEALNDLIYKAVHRGVDKDTGEVQFNYRGMRDLALLVFKFKSTLDNKKNTSETWQQSSIFEQNNFVFTEIDDDFVEPEFPPNSEEEAWFNKYKDELTEKSLQEPIEEHDHYRR